MATLATMRKLLITGKYDEAIKLGQSGLKHLKTIAAGNDTALAVRAVHVAGAMGIDEAATIVAAAAGSRKLALKTAAAATARSLSPTQAEPILARLLKSRDISVRKWAIRSVAALKHEKLYALIDNIRTRESNRFVKQLAHTTTQDKARKPKMDSR